MFKRIILRVTEGGLKGKEFVLENGSTTTLGRSRDCSLSLFDPCCLISRRHCQIEVADPLVRIRDLGSLNGTYVNGEKIDPDRPDLLTAEDSPERRKDYPLWEGDKISLGDYVFEVVFEPHAPCAETETKKHNTLWADACPSCC